MKKTTLKTTKYHINIQQKEKINEAVSVGNTSLEDFLKIFRKKGMDKAFEYCDIVEYNVNIK